MSIRLSTNFDFKSNLPLDARLTFNTEDEMLNYAKENLYYGAITHIKNTNKTYMYVVDEYATDNKTPLGGKWVNIFSDGAYEVTAEHSKYDNKNSKLIATNVQAAIDEAYEVFKTYKDNDRWAQAVDTINDLPASAQTSEVRIVGGSALYVFNGTRWLNIIETHIISNATQLEDGLMSKEDKMKVDKLIMNDATGDKYLANDGTYKTVTAVLSTDDQAKLDKADTLITDGAGNKVLADNGNYVALPTNATTTSDGLMSKDDKIKVDKILTDGNGDKYLTDDGIYKTITPGTVLTADQITKINTVKISKDGGTGSMFLADDGTYKTISASGISSDDQAKLNAININGDADKFLAGDGTYKSISASGLTADQLAKVNTVISSTDTNKGDGSKFLSDDGTYKAVTGVSTTDQVKLDKIITTGDGNLVLANNGDYVTLPTIPGLATQTDDGLMSSTDKTKLDGFITNGDGTTFLANDGSYKTISSGTTLTPTELARINTIKAAGEAGTDSDKYLSEDGTYKTVTATLSADDQAKLNAIETGGLATNYLGEDGIYHAIPVTPGNATTSADGLMSSSDKTKLDGIGIDSATGSDTKYLNEKGQFVSITTSLTQAQIDAVNKIKTNGDGSNVLADNGQYVTLPTTPSNVTTTSDGLMTKEDKIKLDGIAINVSGSDKKFLNEQGQFTNYVTAAADVTYDATGTKFTSNNMQDILGEVLDVVATVNDTTPSNTDVYSSSKTDSLLSAKSNTGHTHTVSEITDITTNYYTAAQVDAKISASNVGMIWQNPVATEADIAATYPTPVEGWTVITTDTNAIYRYDGSTWVRFGGLKIYTDATQTESGLMSATDKVKLDGIDTSAPRIYYGSTEPPRVNGNIWVQD